MKPVTHTSEPSDGDAAVVELLRGGVSRSVAELARGLGVTATAVRQRLERLMQAGLVGRKTVAQPRGRPAHAYSLTERGQRLGGDNFRDLALVLWREIRAVRDASVRQGLIGRVGKGLAEAYRDDIRGDSAEARLRSVADLLARRDVSCSVERDGLPVLTNYSCPYPDLAEQDRSICAAERLMIQELVGTSVQLSECRLDGTACCRFTAADAGLGGAEEGLRDDD